MLSGVHLRCANLSKSEYNVLSDTHECYYCSKRLSDALPFNCIDDQPACIFKCYFINFPIFNTFWPNNQQLFNLNKNSILNNDDIDPDKNVYNLLHEDCRYYLSCQLQDAIGRLDVSNKLSVLHINARSMSGKLGQIDVLLKAILDGFDILAPSEPGSRPSMNN